MSLTSLLVPTLTQMLTTASGWLDKAEAQMPGGKAEELLTARLAPDMFPFATQFRFACVQAYESVARLSDREVPPVAAELLAEGQGAAENPGSIADLKARISDTLAMLGDLAPDALDKDPQAPLAHTLPMGIVFDLTAEQYVRDWVFSQFYFHIMAGYAILRHKGVELGKVDYIAHMLPHIRPGTMPTG